MTLAELCERYVPYDTMPEFKVGFIDYQIGKYTNPYGDTVAGQAWDRGAEAAMKWGHIVHKY